MLYLLHGYGKGGSIAGSRLACQPLISEGTNLDHSQLLSDLMRTDALESAITKAGSAGKISIPGYCHESVRVY